MSRAVFETAQEVLGHIFCLNFLAEFYRNFEAVIEANQSQIF